MFDINKMTLEQKIGMVLCARRFHPEDVVFIKKLIKNRALGCIQFHAKDKEIIEDVMSVADYPIIVVNDTESGFPGSDLPQIPLISLAACGKKEYYEAYAKGIVRDAKKAGFNATWGPVIDILHMDEPCSVHRKFSDIPEKVGIFAEYIASIYKKNHYLSCGKHYPGGGEGLPLDTHMTEGNCNATKEDVITKNFVPYKHLMDKGLLPSIMIGHELYPNIDPDYPAALSKKHIDILREQGFDGVLFTDSFAMMGILQKYGEENIYGMAIAAGNDIVLVNYRTPFETVYNYLLKNFKDGMFSKERLDEAVRRVLAAMDYVGTKAENPTEFTQEDEKVLNNIARDCITAITDDGIAAKLDGKNEDKLFIITEETHSVDDQGAEVSFGSWYSSKRVGEKIKEAFPGAGVEYLPEFSQASDNQRVLVAATKYKEVIFVTFCNTEPYLGTDALTRRTEAVANALINSGKVSAVLHFGNPYALKNLYHVKRKIFGYHIPESQIYAIEVLKGTIDAKGTLPFDISFN